MTLTITLGLWLIPLAITLVAFIVAEVYRRSLSPGGDLGIDIRPMIAYFLAIVVTLISWLVWALIV